MYSRLLDLVMVLPLWMLHGLQIAPSQKIGIAFIFSLAFACFVLCIMISIESLNQDRALYTILAVNLNVIASCLPTCCALFTLRSRHRANKRSTWRGLRSEGTPGYKDVRCKNSTDSGGNIHIARMKSAAQIRHTQSDLEFWLPYSKIYVTSEIIVADGKDPQCLPASAWNGASPAHSFHHVPTKTPLRCTIATFDRLDI